MADDQFELDFEIWKPIPGWPYIISSHGRIRRTTKYKKPLKDCLKGTVNKAGYLQVCLSQRCKHFNVCIHQLVCEAFCGPCPSHDHEVAHWDGNKRNNHFQNLRWATHAENGADRIRLGECPKGMLHHKAKLTDDDVLEIVRLLREGASIKTISLQFGISESNIKHIKYRRSWTHLTNNAANLAP